MYKTDDFDFNLPKELIAEKPACPRDESKMLVCCDGKFIDRKSKDLTQYLRAGDVIVFNDTKVIKAKLVGKRDEVKIEVNLHKNLGDAVWQVFAKPAKRLKVGNIFKIADDFFAKVIEKHDDGMVDLEFNVVGDEFFASLDKYGHIPLPPYIKRDEQQVNKSDEVSYQTIYAKNNGAVAAPTAGLHFTEELFSKLDEKGVKKVFVTLNVGAGTFLPVKSEYIKDHDMHSEYFTVSKEACEVINNAKKNGGRIVAVGTTSLRVLESAVDENGDLVPSSTDTQIFIYPPYKFKMVDILMTNFHLPKSTLFMLVSAFLGKDKAFELYNHAIENNYRFYSYGDASLLIS